MAVDFFRRADEIIFRRPKQERPSKYNFVGRFFGYFVGRRVFAGSERFMVPRTWRRCIGERGRVVVVVVVDGLAFYNISQMILMCLDFAEMLTNCESSYIFWHSATTKVERYVFLLFWAAIHSH